MYGEDEPAEPRLAQAEFPQQPPHEQRIDQMQREGDEVIAERVAAEEVPLGPKECFLNRIIFDPDAGMKPEARETGAGAQQRVIGDVPVVIPKPVAVKSGRVDPEPSADNQRDAEQDHEAFRKGRFRGGVILALPSRAFGHG